MGNFKGTPGPWVVDIRGGCVAVYQDGRQEDTNGCHPDDDRNISYSKKGAEYDMVAGYWSMDKKTINDFTLIAAAPELLEALQDALHMYDKHGEYPEWDFARAAINKALGEKQ